MQGICSYCQETHDVERSWLPIEMGDVGAALQDGDPSELYVMSSHYPNHSEELCQGSKTMPEALVA